VLFSVTTALQAVAVGWFDMATYRVLSGVGEGVQNAALFAAAGSFLHRSRGLAIGTIAASFGLGAFIGPLLGSFLVGVSGHWQTPLIVFGLLGGVVYATVRFGVPTAAMEYGAGETSAARAAEMGVGAVGKLLNRNVVCSAVAAAAVGYAIYGYLGLYPTYLRDVHGFTAGQASLAVSMFGVGALGAVPGGLVADRVNQRLLNVAGLLGMMLIGTVMFGLSTPLGVQMVLSLLLGVAFTGIIYTNTSALMQRSVAPHLVGRVSGLFVAALYLPASVSGYGLAVVVEGIGWTAGGIIQLTVIPVLGLLAMGVMRPTPRPGTARPPATTISPSAVTDDRHS
jgi:MFS family permease